MHSGLARRDISLFKERLREGAGPFVTRVVSVQPSGARMVETSRRDRKGRGPKIIPAPGEAAPRTIRNPWLRLWAPGRLSWWVAWTFICGSLCFTYGPALGLLPQALAIGPLGLPQVNYVYLAGSMFFTTACYLQFLEAVNAEFGHDFFVSGRRRHHPFRFTAWQPRHLAYLAGLLQLLGALCFNVDCALAMVPSSWLVADATQRLPSVLGSTFFLSSAYLSVVEVCHRWWRWKLRDISWWVVFVNFLGCAGFFLGSALAFVPPGPAPAGILFWDLVFNLSGGLGFFISSYLMLPEMFSE